MQKTITAILRSTVIVLITAIVKDKYGFEYSALFVMLNMYLLMGGS